MGWLSFQADLSWEEGGDGGERRRVPKEEHLRIYYVVLLLYLHRRWREKERSVTPVGGEKKRQDTFRLGKSEAFLYWARERSIEVPVCHQR